jgi:cell shape-determining protein MreC
MAVELEKIASVLDEAYNHISELENKNSELESKMAEMEEQLTLAKQAEDNATVWSNGSSFGSVADDMPASYDTAESRLDSFLSD